MNDSVFETLRGFNRKHFYEIWKKAQSGELQDLSEEEQRLGKIVLTKGTLVLKQLAKFTSWRQLESRFYGFSAFSEPFLKYF
jgi:hypothetical protein